jgi:para-nitrobenzyl esterase
MSAIHGSSAPWKHHDTAVYSETAAVVETTAGKVRGYIRNGIYTFKGVPYGTSVSGAARFVPASLPKPWPGVLACLHYSNICPQFPQQPYSANAPANLGDEDQYLLLRTGGHPVGEDCLVLNVWTPEINGSAQRPVMVWLHGGGFSAGCGHDLLAYDGENLAHKDAVVVTINHRLGLLGHLNLAQLGDERYASSGNIAMLDQVLALQWVRENITRFGGDPHCVMIFGQSGGGGKVTTLMGMPCAQGLFHRAAVQSGSGLRSRPMEDSTDIARDVLNELGIAPFHLEKLHTLPVDALLEAGAAVARRRGRGPLAAWGPVLDGIIIPEQPFGERAPEVSRDVPLLVGTNFHEFWHGVDNPDAYKMTDAEMEARVSGRVADERPTFAAQFKDKASAMIAASRKVYPGLAPFDRCALLVCAFRERAEEQAALKALQNAAPAFYYWFTWRTPVLDGRPGAFHSCEISFVFDNADKYEGYNGGGEVPSRLSDQISDAWLAFARTGNPNHPGLPDWPVYDPQGAATMVFDAPCHVEVAPDTALQRALEG